MWPSHDRAVDLSSTSSSSPAKRKHRDPQGPNPSSANTPPGTSKVDCHSSKKLRPISSSTSPGLRSNMNKTMGFSRPGVVDLTRPSNFQPHTGAKRLVIKNLRISSPSDGEQYFQKTWDELDGALASVFSNQQPVTPLEVL